MIRHLITPFAIALALGFAAATPAGAQSDPTTATQAVQPAAGEKAYQAQCARCHKTAELKPYLDKRPDDAARRRDLDAFLSRHHARDAEQRDAIIAYLLAQPR